MNILTAEDYRLFALIVIGLAALVIAVWWMARFIVAWLRLPFMLATRLDEIGSKLSRIERNTRDKEPADPV